MKSKISEAEVDRMVAQAGLPLSAEQKRALHEAYWMIEGMIERVHKPLPIEAEPAHLFVAEDKR